VTYWVVVSNAQDKLGNQYSWFARCDGPFDTEYRAWERARELRGELHDIIVRRADDPRVFDQEVNKRLTNFDFWVTSASFIADAPRQGVRIRDFITLESIVEEADRILANRREQGKTVKQAALRTIEMAYLEKEVHRTELESLRWAGSPTVLQRDPVCIVTNKRLVFVGGPQTLAFGEVAEAVIEIPVGEINYLESDRIAPGDNDDFAVVIGTLRQGGFLACFQSGGSSGIEARRLESYIRAVADL
jgi:hypothetical protein